MKTEILFPEVANLCGDLMNVTYLRQCCPEMEVVETGLNEPPRLPGRRRGPGVCGLGHGAGPAADGQGPGPYRAELERYVDGGGLMLATGNALDALGEYVVIDGKRTFDGLGILKTHAEYHMMKRHNSFLLGSYQDMEIVGFKSLFGHTYPDDELANPLFRVERGVGRHPGAFAEGFLRGGLMATYLIGPLLPLNPPFTRYLLEQMGAKDVKPAFEDTAMKAYLARVEEFRDEKRGYQY